MNHLKRLKTPGGQSNYNPYNMKHIPVTPLRRIRGGVILLIFRNREGIVGEIGGEFLSFSSGNTFD